MSCAERINYPLVNEVRISGSWMVEKKIIKDPNKISLIISLVKLMKKRCKKIPYFVDTPQLLRYKVDLLDGDKQDVVGSISIVGCNKCWATFWNDEWHAIPSKGAVKELANKVIKAIK